MPNTITLSASALEKLLPFHLRVSTTSGTILTSGPTLERLSGYPLTGLPFEEVFELRSPLLTAIPEGLPSLAGQRLRIVLRDLRETPLRGLAIDSGAGEVLFNLSLGITLPDAVRHFRLTEADFAPTDLAVELLYLLEARSLVTSELRALNTRLQEAHILAETQAQTDPLTGLHNRRSMDRHLLRLTKGAKPFGLMQLDLDYFKQVNDILGHAAGDHVLLEVARILTAETREADIVARVGGDEFVLLFPEVTAPERLQAIAARIIRRLSQPIPFDGQTCQISASIGIAVAAKPPHPTPDRLLQQADEALYLSKRQGRGRATLSSGGYEKGGHATGTTAPEGSTAARGTQPACRLGASKAAKP